MRRRAEFIAPDYIEGTLARINRLRMGEPVEREYDIGLIRKDGQRLFVHASIGEAMWHGSLAGALAGAGVWDVRAMRCSFRVGGSLHQTERPRGVGRRVMSNSGDCKEPARAGH